MITDIGSEHWSECRAYVERLVNKNCSDLEYAKEDLIQEIMHSVSRGLSTFRFESKLKTWIIIVAKNRANDFRRKKRNLAWIEVSINYSNDEENEDREADLPHDLQTPEDTYLINEYIEEVNAEIAKFILRYTKSERNRKILHMFFIEELDIKTIATTFGMKAPAVSTVIRSARLHLRAWHNEHPL